MGWSSGTYRKGNYSTNGWTGDASLGIGIEAGRHDTQDDDFETGINTCLTKDGQNAATGNLPMGGFKHTNVASGTARNHYAAVAQLQDDSIAWCGTSGGSANAQTLTPSPAITAYTAGQRFRFIAGYTNTSTATLNVSGLGAKNIFSQGNTAALLGNEIIANRIYDVVYDGTQFILMNSLAAGNFTADNLANNRLLFFKSRGTSSGTNTIVQSGDQLGGIWFYGANGTGYDPAAAVIASCDTTPGASADMPGRLEFWVTPNGTATLAEGARLTNDKQFMVARTSTVFTTEYGAFGPGTGTAYLSVYGGTSGTGGGGALAAKNGTTTIAALGGYSAAYSGGAYDATPTLYFNAGPKVLGLAAGAGTHAMKWNNTTYAWTYDTSSARYKENITDCQYGLNDVLKMRPTSFTYKAEPERHDVGFIAEEMNTIIPEIVAKNAENQPDAISYDRLTAVLCRAIQELEARVAELEAK